MTGIALVALGSALGGMARFWLSGLIDRRCGPAFPWGTILVNVSGAFAVGLIAAAADANGVLAASDLWQLAVTGFLGGYTTVSAFSLQTLALARDGGALRAGGNVVLSLVLCLGAVALGFTLGAASLE
jgi:CrcB protein